MKEKDRLPKQAGNKQRMIVVRGLPLARGAIGQGWPFLWLLSFGHQKKVTNR